MHHCDLLCRERISLVYYRWLARLLFLLMAASNAGCIRDLSSTEWASRFVTHDGAHIAISSAKEIQPGLANVAGISDGFFARAPDGCYVYFTTDADVTVTGFVLAADGCSVTRNGRVMTLAELRADQTVKHVQ